MGYGVYGVMVFMVVNGWLACSHRRGQIILSAGRLVATNEDAKPCYTPPTASWMYHSKKKYKARDNSPPSCVLHSLTICLLVPRLLCFALLCFALGFGSPRISSFLAWHSGVLTHIERMERRKKDIVREEC